ncbi:MAG TPA: NlpC/P60 family protein, partial [Anaerolineae bacterium]|nr:NlpC/P60 family protein [Anaerolineae bacterium]
MYRQRATYILSAIVILFTQANPALAEPIPNQATAVQSTDTTTAVVTREDTETATTEVTATPAPEQAQVDPEVAARQARAERMMRELDALGDELEGLDTDYLAESAKLSAIKVNLDETQERLRWYEAELEAQRQIFNNRLANIYKHGRVEPLEAFISKISFKDVFARLGLLIKIGEQDAELLQDIESQKLKVETAERALDQLYEQQRQVTIQLEERRKVIETKIQEETALLTSIDPQTKAILDQKDAERRRQQLDIINRLQTRTDSDKISLQPGTVGFEAIKYLGVPYVWGGEDPATGLDCSGLAKVVYKKFGIDLPHYSRSQAQLGIGIGYDELQSGDLVFFGHPIHHVGIYLGEGYYIHAPKRNDVVKISR